MTYEYSCDSCQHGFTAEQSIKDAPLTHCPQCWKETVHRVINSRGGHFVRGGASAGQEPPRLTANLALAEVVNCPDHGQELNVVAETGPIPLFPPSPDPSSLN